MAISLQKGQSLSLSKTASGSKRSKVVVGLGWEVVQTPLDLDAVVYVAKDLGNDAACVEKDEHMVFFGNKEAPGGGVVHSGDNRNGEGEGDDETVAIDFDKLEASCPNADLAMVFVVLFEKAPDGSPLEEAKMTQRFGMLRNAGLRVYEEASKDVICSYDLDDSFGNNFSVHIGNFRKKAPGSWDFEAVGVGFNLNLLSICKRLKVPSFA